MAYDSVRSVIVLFGGCSARAPAGWECSAPLADTWEYDGMTWTECSLPVAPPAQAGHSMAFDAARGVVVLFNGPYSPGETWEYWGP